MYEIYLTLRSVTVAQRARDVCNRVGIRCVMQNAQHKVFDEMGRLPHQVHGGKRKNRPNQVQHPAAFAA